MDQLKTTELQSSKPQLIDRFGRHITYVRLSVTDRCDFRCVYCMAEDMTFVPREQLLTLEEMERVGRAFVQLGVHKIRLTGGEPLTRRGVLQLIQGLGSLEGLRDFTVTTNGSQLPRFAVDLKAAGITRLNISLDTLRADRFRQLTRTGHIEQTLAGIEAALAQGFKRIKLNAVILKNRNHDEVLDLVAFARERHIDISFIEEMPLGEIGDHDRAEAYYSSDEILRDLRTRYDLQAVNDQTGGPSRYYKTLDHDSRVGFISPHSHNFCGDCNRVRVTAEGRLLLCLGQEHSVDLRRVLRAHPLSDEPLIATLKEAMQIKPQGHEFQLAEKPILFRHMNATGG
ncbi:GTP 3',8-cyclase MoaA [Thiolinea disciformis]|uniref:GTP 3',8-cyclase MoaA n=1 Tax=Thiolinea disciformis TaxID=125614 RepID=UPI00035D73A2|nr:GTP 3',8-cyclase MoaA [Thiolinea disciformis]